MNWIILILVITLIALFLPLGKWKQRFIFWKMKKSNKETNGLEDPESFEDPDCFEKEYRKLTQDMKYVNDNSATYIIQSLENEFSEYREYIKGDWVRETGTQSKNHWVVEEFTYCNLTLERVESTSSSYRVKKVKINIQYDWTESNMSIIIQNIRVSGPSFSVDGKLEKTIKKYLMSLILEEKKKKFRECQENMENIIKIVGKDTVRDQRIEDILKSE
jgi:hypothetical protein